MSLEDIAYSHEETIAAVTDYYTFLTRMYLKESHIVYPPPAGGWPAIVNADPAALQALGKSDEVLSLLAYLPYIPQPPGRGEDYAAQLAPESTAADWLDLFGLLSIPVAPDDSYTRAQEIRMYTEGTFADRSPAHVVGLICDPDQAMVLDTELGIIHWQGCPSRINYGRYRETSVDWDLDDEVPQEEADWRYSATAWATPDFFEVLKDQFRQLHWIPISYFAVRDVPEGGDWPQEEGMMSMLQDIYRQDGWPDLAVYRKSECLEAVRKAMAEKYPESCYRENA